MNIEKQVCTQKQAEKLKQLGILQQSIFRWSFENEWEIMQGEQTNTDDCSAFTVSELGIIIGRGSKAAEAHWQWLIDSLNSGLSGTVAYNPVALAGFVITQIEIGNVNVSASNNRLFD